MQRRTFSGAGGVVAHHLPPPPKKNWKIDISAGTLILNIPFLQKESHDERHSVGRYLSGNARTIELRSIQIRHLFVHFDLKERKQHKVWQMRQAVWTNVKGKFKQTADAIAIHCCTILLSPQLHRNRWKHDISIGVYGGSFEAHNPKRLVLLFVMNPWHESSCKNNSWKKVITVTLRV